MNGSSLLTYLTVSIGKKYPKEKQRENNKQKEKKAIKG